MFVFFFAQGDSGGPLMTQYNQRWTLIGIVSWGEGYVELFSVTPRKLLNFMNAQINCSAFYILLSSCAIAKKPGVYTDVGNYITWIKQITGLPWEEQKFPFYFIQTFFMWFVLMRTDSVLFRVLMKTFMLIIIRRLNRELFVYLLSSVYRNSKGCTLLHMQYITTTIKLYSAVSSGRESPRLKTDGRNKNENRKKTLLRVLRDQHIFIEFRRHAKNQLITSEKKRVLLLNNNKRGGLAELVHFSSIVFMKYTAHNWCRLVNRSMDDNRGTTIQLRYIWDGSPVTPGTHTNYQINCNFCCIFGMQPNL